MTVAPLNPEPVGTHERERERPDVSGDACRVEQGTPAHFLYASGARTSQPESSGREEPFMAVLVPLDQETVVPAIDGVGGSSIAQ